MILKKFDKLPDEFQNEDVYKYYRILKKKKLSIFLKRVFDFIIALFALIVLTPLIVAISIIIKCDSPGEIIFKQKRITTYGKVFHIYKFRTMYTGSENGSQVTVNNDSRVTKSGRFLRKYRLDELLQVLNILKGEMSFVGTRPEVEKYVDCYTDEMYATLLLPAGVTSLASIKYKDEEKLLADSKNVDATYVNDILKQKMKFNLQYVSRFSVFYDIVLMVKTVLAVFKSDECETADKEDKPVNV